MKLPKLIVISLALVFSAPAFADLKVFTCEPHWAALVKVIGGDHVEVTSATGAYNDPHYIQARPSLISKMRRADLVVCNGAQLEIGWLPILLRQGDNPKVQPGQPGYLEAATLMQLLDVPTSVDRAQGDIHPDGNPHVQTDPNNIALVAPVLEQRMAQLDPANAAYYQQHYQTFNTKFSAAIKHWTEEAAPLKGMQIIAYHEGWVYMAHWLGIDVVGHLEPKPGIPPSPAHLAELLTQIRSQHVQGIIYTPYEDEQAADWLSSRTGIPAAKIPDTVGADRDPDLFTYYNVMVQQLLKLHGEAK
ncbi:MAG TPA: zinc ABC transporter substrate-binding protein [Gammaproteobacteria bacterium]|nr:zinc ABC transporter substrate-binding protein [Gammaproteobacteria bacterium]